MERRAHEKAVFHLALMGQRIQPAEFIIYQSRVAQDQRPVAGGNQKAAEHTGIGDAIGKIIDPAEPIVGGYALQMGKVAQCQSRKADSQCAPDTYAAPPYKYRSFVTDAKVSTAVGKAAAEEVNHDLAYSRQLMDMLVSVQKGGWGMEGFLEGVQLPFQLPGDLFDDETPRESGTNQSAECGKSPVRCGLAHGAKGHQVCQGEVQTNIDGVAETVEPCRMFWPIGAGSHATGGGKTTGLDKIANARADAGRKGEIVSAKHDCRDVVRCGVYGQCFEPSSRSSRKEMSIWPRIVNADRDGRRPVGGCFARQSQ